MINLTLNQMQILRFLVKDYASDRHLSGRAISSALGHRASYWASDKLRSLEEKGLARNSAISPKGSYLYQATLAGIDYVGEMEKDI